MRVRPSGVLWVFRWREAPVFLRLRVGPGSSERPPCPRLYDDIIAIPVINPGQPPPVGIRARRFSAIADWLADVADEQPN